MFDDPTTPLTAVPVWNEMDGGPTAAGEMVSERTAMAASTVYTCVTTLAEAVASLPCKLMKHVDKGWQEAVNNYLCYLLATEPNPEMTALNPGGLSANITLFNPLGSALSKKLCGIATV